MELMAVISGLEALNRPCQVDVYSDSKYVVDAFNQHWVDSWIKKNWKKTCIFRFQRNTDSGENQNTGE